MFALRRAPVPWLVLLSVLACNLSLVVAAERELTPADIAPGQRMGQSAAMTRSHLVVGSAFDSTAGTNSGAVYVFVNAAGGLPFKLRAPASDADADDQFGLSVAVSGNVVAIGAPFEEAGGQARGAVYLYDLSTGEHLTTITAPGGADHDGFGAAVAMSGEYLIIGAPHRDALVAMIDAGAVYIYHLGTGAISGPILAPLPLIGAKFGSSVAVSGNLVAVGAPDELIGILSLGGAVYLLDAGTNTHLARFTATTPAGSPDVQAGDSFGASVTFAGSRLIVGAPGRDSGAGKVFAFDTATLSPTALWVHDGTAAGGGAGSALAGSDELVVIGVPGATVNGAAGAGEVLLLQPVDGALVDTLRSGTPMPGDALGTAVAVRGSMVFATSPGRDGQVPDGGSASAFSNVLPQLPFLEVAMQGALPPGAPGTVFARFTQLAVSPSAYTGLQAVVTGPGATLGRNRGIWTNGNPAAPDVLANVRRTGTLLLGQRHARSVLNPVTNVDGLLGFTSVTSGPGVTGANDVVVAVWNGTAMTLPFTEGMLVADGHVSRFFPPRQSNAGAQFVAPYLLARRGGISAVNDSGLAAFNETTVNGGKAEGGVSPIAADVFHGQFLPRAALAGNRMTFTNFLQGVGVDASNNIAVFDDTTMLARKGETAPDVSGSALGIFTHFLGETNNGTDSFFLASMAPADGNMRRSRGIWSNRTGLVRPVILTGQSYTGLPDGVTIRRFIRFAGNANGDLIAWVQLQGVGVTAVSDGAILLSRKPAVEPAALEVLLREGFQAPGGGGARVGAIQLLDTSSGGGYAVLTTLLVQRGLVTARDNQALLLGNSSLGSPQLSSLRKPVVVLRKGMGFTRDGSPLFVTRIGLPGMITDATGGLNTGLARLVTTIDSTPVCSAVVTFHNRKSAVLTIAP